MRVRIASSDAGVRDAFLDALRRADIGVTSVAEAAATLELARQRPNVVVLDDELPGIGGLAGLQKLGAETPDSELVVPAARFDRRSGVRAVLAGAAGYLSRGVAPDALPRIVRGVMRGEAAIPRTLTMALVERLRALARSEAGTRSTVDPLSSREWEVLDLMATGASPRESLPSWWSRLRPSKATSSDFGQARDQLAGGRDRDRAGAPPPAPRLSRPLRARAARAVSGQDARATRGRQPRPIRVVVSVPPSAAPGRLERWLSHEAPAGPLDRVQGWAPQTAISSVGSGPSASVRRAAPAMRVERRRRYRMASSRSGGFVSSDPTSGSSADTKASKWLRGNASHMSRTTVTFQRQAQQAETSPRP